MKLIFLPRFQRPQAEPGKEEEIEEENKMICVGANDNGGGSDEDKTPMLPGELRVYQVSHYK